MSLVLLIFCTGLFDRIEAVAGDEIFLKSEMDEIALIYGGEDTTRKLIRQELVNRALLMKKAERETIQVRDEEISAMLESRIAMLTQQYGGEEGLYEECQRLGLTLQQLKQRYRKEIRSQLLMRRFLEKKSQSYLVVTPTEVKKFYEQHKDSIAFRPGTVVLKHILITIKPSKKQIQEAARKISEIYDLLMRGAEFKVLAEEFSDDPYSGKRGGSLGWIKRGETVEEFENIIFRLKPGEISQPFQTRFGLHIAEVLSKDEKSVLVRQILIAVSPTKKDTIRAYNTAKRLIDHLIKGADFDSIARIYSEDPMIKQGSSLLGEFIEDQIPPIFAQEIKALGQDEISKPILSPYGYHIIKVVKRQKQKVLSYEEMRPRIEEYLREQKLEKEYEKWSQRTKKEIFNIEFYAN